MVGKMWDEITYISDVLRRVRSSVFFFKFEMSSSIEEFWLQILWLTWTGKPKIDRNGPDNWATQTPQLKKNNTLLKTVSNS